MTESLNPVFAKALLDAIETGHAIATSSETVDGIPTIHQFRGANHHGFGCFSAQVEGKGTVHFDGGGAMKHVTGDDGKDIGSYTYVTGEEQAVKHYFDKVLASENLRALLGYEPQPEPQPEPVTYGPDDDLEKVEPGDTIVFAPTAYEVERAKQEPAFQVYTPDAISELRATLEACLEIVHSL